MTEIVKLNKLEKRQYLLYLSILSVFTVTLFSFIIFRKSQNPFKSVNDFDAAFLAKNVYFSKTQKEILPLCDTLFHKISILKSIPTTAFIEADIKNDIATVNSFDESMMPSKDPRLVAFKQIANFQRMYFEDVLILKRKLQNIEYFKTQLEKCEIGYKDKQNFINQLKTADQSKGK